MAKQRDARNSCQSGISPRDETGDRRQERAGTGRARTQAEAHLSGAGLWSGEAVAGQRLGITTQK